MITRERRQLVTLTALCSVAFFAFGSPVSSQEGDPLRGEKLFRFLGCQTCHTVRGVGGGGETRAPELASLYGKVVELEGGQKVTVDDAYVFESITKPDVRIVKGYPAGKMPQRFTHLPKKDLASIVAYVRGLSGKGPSAAGASAAGHSHSGAPTTIEHVEAVAPSVWLWVVLGFFGGVMVSVNVIGMARSVSWSWIALIVAIPVLSVAASVGGANIVAGPSAERYYEIKARQFAYDPPVLRVNRGDRVTIALKSEDVLHGFYLDGYGIDKEIRPGEMVRFSFVADKAGRFSYRCSRTCGVFHPFMIGNLIVEPNNLFYGSLGLCFGLAIATFLYIVKKGE